MRMMFSVKILLVFLLAFQLSAQTYSAPQTSDNQQEVIARGMGAVISGDLAKAEEDAISNALRNAVEQVIGTMIQSEVLVQNYQTIEDRIYSQSAGYVERYEVIGKSRQGDKILEGTIKAG